MENKETFLVIDGNSIMNRSFYGIRLLSVKDGTYTNAVYGFLSTYYMIENMLKPDYVAVAFDVSAPTFRHKMYDEYKAGRRAMPDELRPQMSLIKDVLRAMNIKVMELEGYEADDILGTVAKTSSNKNIHTYILTGDKDSLQLISDTSSVVMPGKSGSKTEYTIFTPEVLKENMNIEPRQVIELKALMGDKSDNIPGVPKVGEKTAQNLLELYDNIDNIYENIDTIDISEKLRENLKTNKELAYLSKTLATINTNVPIELNYDELKLKDVNLPEVSKIFTRLGFKKFLERYIDESEELNLTTDTQTAFYSKLNDTTFTALEDVESLKNVLSGITERDKLPFIYLDEKIEIAKLRETLLFKINNKMYGIRLSLKNKEEVLKTFVSLRCEKVGYNIKKLLNLAFRANAHSIYGFNNDIMIAYYLINTLDNNHSIENITYNILDINFPEIKDATKKSVQTSMFDMLEDQKIDTSLSSISDDEKKIIYTYLHGILSMYSRLDTELKEDGLEELYSKIEMPLVETLAYIENNGMYVDKTKLKEFGYWLDVKLEELTKSIYKLAGEEFNINSPSQLGKILFEKLELPYSKKTKSGYSTDKETLELLEDKHGIIPLILEYRTLAKLKSTYIDSLIEVISEDGRVHTTFMQTVTATGRLSSIEPNLQNIPVRTDLGSRIRECFVAEKSGYKLIDADYSQIELRVLADMSEDENMMSAYNNDIDIHTVTASQVFGVPINEVTKELRGKAKAVNFGIVYGISDYGLAKNINSTRQEAKVYIDNYLNHYAGVANFMKTAIEEAKEIGYAKTKYGRKRQVPELKSANFNTRTFGERVAMNMPIQGTAADIMKIAMNDLYHKMKELNLKSKLIMQVHDELIIEAPEDEVEQVKKLMIESMQNAAKLKVKLIVDVNVGNSWLEAK